MIESVVTASSVTASVKSPRAARQRVPPDITVRPPVGSGDVAAYRRRPSSGHSVLSRSKIAQAVRRHRAGETAAALSRDMGVSLATMQETLIAAGEYRPRVRFSSATREDLDTVLDLASRGFAHAEIARRIGCEERSVGQWLRRMGRRPDLLGSLDDDQVASLADAAGSPEALAVMLGRAPVTILARMSAVSARPFRRRPDPASVSAFPALVAGGRRVAPGQVWRPTVTAAARAEGRPRTVLRLLGDDACPVVEYRVDSARKDAAPMVRCCGARMWSAWTARTAAVPDHADGAEPSSVPQVGGVVR